MRAAVRVETASEQGPRGGTPDPAGAPLLSRDGINTLHSFSNEAAVEVSFLACRKRRNQSHVLGKLLARVGRGWEGEVCLSHRWSTWALL